MSLRSEEKDIAYLATCLFAAQAFSTCGKRQYFSIITGRDGRVVGTGYNGSPPGMVHCIDGACPRFQEGSPPGSSYDNCISNHAEQNALLYSDRTARALGTIYVNGPPCFTCAKLIAGSGVDRLTYILDDTYEQWPEIITFLRQNRIDVFGYSKTACLNRFNVIQSGVLGT